MEIRLLSLLEGARRAAGTVVIIDVYRAFTTAAVALQRGAARILLVDTPESAFKLRREGRGDLCLGEVSGIKVPGFDFGNSPLELSRADVHGKTLIQSTSAGTKGVVAAGRAEALFAAALINAEATVRAVLTRNPSLVSLVAMGTNGAQRSDEDEQCALYMRNRLRDRRPDPAAVRSLVLSAHDSAKFDDPKRPHFDPRDRDMALQIDSIPFAVRVRVEGDLLVATPETLP
ncbi:MAG: 2-phosphosulfolactate phosphatase [Desulfobacterales bacterium]|jgi:2-phosphosulfolactate phosphatase